MLLVLIGNMPEMTRSIIVRRPASDSSQKTTELKEPGINAGYVDEPLFPDKDSVEGIQDQTAPTILAGNDTEHDEAEFDVPDYLSELGRYSIEQEIARGGMGLVLKARDRYLHRDVAIKLLLRKLRKNEYLRDRFVAEAQITSQLQHPGVVPVYDVGFCEDGRPYFAMKLVGGEVFSKIIKLAPQNPLDRYRCLKIFEKVCDTMAYAHSQGVVHLDLKPSNVMVGQFGEVHVMDWGLSCFWGDQQLVSLLGPHGSTPVPNCDSTLAIGGTINGTPAYMSPEQARDNLVDARADVFGLGGMLCELLTGQPPFKGKNLQQVCTRAAWARHDEAMVALDQCDGDNELIDLAKDCLAADPDDRPNHAGEVAFEVTAHLESATEYAQSDLERFFELSMDMFCIAGLDGFFHRVNSNFSRVLGFTEREFLSRPVETFVHPDDHEKTEQAFEVLGKGMPIVRFQNRYRDTQGNYHAFEWTAKSIPEERTVFAVARDVTGSERDLG